MQSASGNPGVCAALHTRNMHSSGTSENRMFKGIGQKLRAELRDIVEARLPDRLRAVLDRLASVDEPQEHHQGRAVVGTP